MKKILITGTAGLIGSHFSSYLLDKGYEVIGIDNLSGGYHDFVDTRLIESGKFYNIELNDVDAVNRVFQKHEPEFVYHFAAYAAEGLSPFIRYFNYNNNLGCSANVINACIETGVKKIIFTSSMAVYGHGTPPFLESQLPAPADPYGIAKYAVELDLQQAHAQFGLRYSIVRPHNVIGTKQNIWDKYRNVIGIWIRTILSGNAISIFGDGSQKRAFSDIRYCMEPFEKLMAMGDQEIYNVGADQEHQLKDVAILIQRIASEYGYTSPIEYLEERMEVKNAYCDHTKARTELDLRDNTDIEVTIREMFNWARDQPKREVKTMQYEIKKNMYSFWK